MMLVGGWTNPLFFKDMGKVKLDHFSTDPGKKWNIFALRFIKFGGWNRFSNKLEHIFPNQVRGFSCHAQKVHF